MRHDGLVPQLAVQCEQKQKAQRCQESSDPLIGNQQRSPGQKRHHIAANQIVAGASFWEEHKCPPMNATKKRNDDGTIGLGNQYSIKTWHRPDAAHYAGNQWQGAAIGEGLRQIYVALLHRHLLHLSEQYFTCSQIFSHFLRQAKGLPQRAQILTGKSAFLIPLGIGNRTDHSVSSDIFSSVRDACTRIAFCFSGVNFAQVENT